MVTFAWEHMCNPYKIELINEFCMFFNKSKLDVLDLAAGAGHYSRYLSEKGHFVTAVDAHLIGKFPTSIKTMEMDLEKALTFNDASFDVVLAFDILEHIKKDNLFINQIWRVLRPGGLLLMSVPNSDDSRIASSYLTYCHFKDKTHVREYTLTSLRQSLMEHHFSVEKIELTGGQSYPGLILCFIDSKIFKLITRIYLYILKRFKILNVKDCHGDIFAAARKISIFDHHSNQSNDSQSGSIT